MKSKDPCIGCPYEGRGSEHCIAIIGDYCRAANEYIEETEEDIKFLEGIKKNEKRRLRTIKKGDVFNGQEHC